MSTIFLYLDDGDQEESVAYSSAVMAVTPKLIIEHKYPSVFREQLDLIRGKSFIYDGIIIDLRLDLMAHEVDGIRQNVDYRAPALTQELRTRAAEKRDREFPIVLWSFDFRLKESYRRDRTSHDLFDLIVVKDELIDDQFAAIVGQKLISLVEGYKTIANIRDNEKRRVGWFYRLLGFEKVEEASFLDSRLLGHFDFSELKRPVHEHAIFIIRHLLDTSGPLIDRAILAARLGLDFSTSSDFEKLLNQFFSNAKYTGPFASGWERWWAFKIEETWHDCCSSAKSLRLLNATERTDILKSVSQMSGLEPAKPINPDYSTRYWTICQALKRPLDPRNGFLMRRERSFPWESEQFVSFEAYENRRVKRRDIDPIDQRRLESMKEQRAS